MAMMSMRSYPHLEQRIERSYVTSKYVSDASFGGTTGFAILLNAFVIIRWILIRIGVSCFLGIKLAVGSFTARGRAKTTHKVRRAPGDGRGADYGPEGLRLPCPSLNVRSSRSLRPACWNLSRKERYPAHASHDRTGALREARVE
jgi:hypothetical protein